MRKSLDVWWDEFIKEYPLPENKKPTEKLVSKDSRMVEAKSTIDEKDTKPKPQKSKTKPVVVYSDDYISASNGTETIFISGNGFGGRIISKKIAELFNRHKR